MIFADKATFASASNGTQYITLRATRYSRDGEVIEQEELEVTSVQWTNADYVQLGADDGSASTADLGLDIGATDFTLTMGQDGNVVTVGSTNLTFRSV